MKLTLKPLLYTCLTVGIWINLSEILRYFTFVMPMTRHTLHMVPNVAPMNLAVFLVWGLWDTLLTLTVVWIYWLHPARFGPTLFTALIAGPCLRRWSLPLHPPTT